MQEKDCVPIKYGLYPQQHADAEIKSVESEWLTRAAGCDLQGIMGTIPWNALVFLTLYMQLMGMSDFDASMLMSLFLGSTALGGLLGGGLGTGQQPDSLTMAVLLSHSSVSSQEYPCHGSL